MRIKDWRIVLAFLILFAAAIYSFGATVSSSGNTPLLTHEEPSTEREFQEVYRKIAALTVAVSTGTFIPSGLIAMFDASCPSGWTRFSALDQNVAVGSTTYGVTGGAATHTHSISTQTAHSHFLGTSATSTAGTLGVDVGYNTASGIAGVLSTYGPAGATNVTFVTAGTNSTGEHNHTG